MKVIVVCSNVFMFLRIGVCHLIYSVFQHNQGTALVSMNSNITVTGTLIITNNTAQQGGGAHVAEFGTLNMERVKSFACVCACMRAFVHASVRVSMHACGGVGGGEDGDQCSSISGKSEHRVYHHVYCPLYCRQINSSRIMVKA